MYVRHIDPGEEAFKRFISNYLAMKGVKNPQTLPYSELYRDIQEGIREYLKQKQSTRSKK